MNRAHVGTRGTMLPSVYKKVFLRSLIALKMQPICWAATDMTSSSTRLNSSWSRKMPQEAVPR